MKSYFIARPWFYIVFAVALVLILFGAFRCVTKSTCRIELDQVQYITAYGNGVLICILSDREEEAFVTAFEELELRRMLIAAEEPPIILGYEHKFTITFLDGNQSSIIIARPYIIVDDKYYKCSDKSWGKMGAFIQSLMDQYVSDQYIYIRHMDLKETIAARLILPKGAHLDIQARPSALFFYWLLIHPHQLCDAFIILSCP